MKKQESGRSMVEMLGVLAVIGVLSVGGIAGYTLSMRRHRANAIVDTVAKYAAISYGACHQAVANGTMPDLTGCVSVVGSTGPLYYENTDLGPYPAGVTYIVHSSIGHNSKTGNDIVYTSVQFEDKKLCQTVASIIGITCPPDNALNIPINQN